MYNIDPTLYGSIMLEQKQAKQLYDIKRMEIVFEKYKKRIKTIEEQEHTNKKGEPEKTRELSNSEFYQLSGVRDGFLDDMIIGNGAKFWTDEKYYYFYDGFVSLRKFYRVDPCKLVLFTFGAWRPQDDIKDVLWQKWEIFGRLE